jgi:hypothetical protein
MSEAEQQETLSHVQRELRLVKQRIAELSEDDRIQIQAIACSLRNAIAAGGSAAYVAFALVCAEIAAIE